MVSMGVDGIGRHQTPASSARRIPSRPCGGQQYGHSVAMGELDRRFVEPGIEGVGSPWPPQRPVATGSGDDPAGDERRTEASRQGNRKRRPSRMKRQWPNHEGALRPVAGWGDEHAATQCDKPRHVRHSASGVSARRHQLITPCVDPARAVRVGDDGVVPVERERSRR